MKRLLKNNIWVAGAILGAAGGYLYWHYVGCVSGTCAITSRPFNSTLYFGIMGALLFNMFRPRKNKLPDNDTTPGDGKTTGKSL